MSERDTLTLCLACEGEYRRFVQKDNGKYKTEICKWCYRGAMTDEQIKAWGGQKNGSAQRNSAGTARQTSTKDVK